MDSESGDKDQDGKVKTMPPREYMKAEWMDQFNRYTIIPNNWL